LGTIGGLHAWALANTALVSILTAAHTCVCLCQCNMADMCHCYKLQGHNFHSGCVRKSALRIF
jgi:hypothetical protein